MNSKLDLLEREAPPVPDELANAARAQTGLRADTQPRRNFSIPAIVAIALVGLSFTPPGRAATGWVADVAGFGDEPTLPQANVADGSARVIMAGSLSDGTAYEVVTKRPKGVRGSLCFGTDWPGSQKSGGGGICIDPEDFRSGDAVTLTTGVSISTPPGRRGRDRRGGPGLLVGETSLQPQQDIVVEALTADGSTRLSSEVIEVSGEPLEAAGATVPVHLYSAPVDTGTMDGIRDGSIRLRVAAVGEDGEILGAYLAIAPGMSPSALRDALASRTDYVPPHLLNDPELGLDRAPLDRRLETLSFSWTGALPSQAMARLKATLEYAKQQQEVKREAALIDRPPASLNRIPRSGIALGPDGKLVYWFELSAFRAPPVVAVYGAENLEPIRVALGR